MYKLVLYVSLFFLSVAGCTNDVNDIDCSDVACTLDFRSFDVTLTDVDNNPVALDQFTVTDITNNEDLTNELNDDQFQEARQMGIYPLYGDRFTQLHQNKVKEIVFKGLVNGNEVVSAQFTVGADCCHTKIISGDLEIMIN
jgi:hypothetical protein